MLTVIERRPAGIVMVRTRRPATNSVIRRMLRPLIVTRKDRVPQRAWVRSRAEADAACVPATPAAGWLAGAGAALATGVGVGVTGWPATLLSFGQLPLASRGAPFGHGFWFTTGQLPLASRGAPFGHGFGFTTGQLPLASRGAPFGHGFGFTTGQLPFASRGAPFGHGFWTTGQLPCSSRGWPSGHGFWT